MNLDKKKRIQGMIVDALQEEYDLQDKKDYTEIILAVASFLMGIFGMLGLMFIADATYYDFVFSFRIFLTDQILIVPLDRLLTDILYTLPLVAGVGFLTSSIILSILAIKRDQTRKNILALAIVTVILSLSGLILMAWIVM